MRLEGEKVLLRPLDVADVEAVLKLRGDESVRQSFLLPPRPRSREKERQEYEFMLLDDRAAYFAIVFKDDNGSSFDLIMGVVHVKKINWFDRRAEFGIALMPEYQGMGYGTEAARLMLGYVFQEVGLNKVVLEVLAQNERARRMYERLGFEVVGKFKWHTFQKGRYHDVFVMELFHDRLGAEVEK